MECQVSLPFGRGLKTPKCESKKSNVNSVKQTKRTKSRRRRLDAGCPTLGLKGWVLGCFFLFNSSTLEL
jgi:hypothetical protein